MSLHYLLDGYNIINQLPSLAQKVLEDKRSALVGLIETYKPQGSSRNTVTIVFDGKSGICGSHSSSIVKVVFTSDESADDKIKRLVAQAANKKLMVVVTDDREIKYYVRALGACVVSVKEFLEKLRPKEAKAKKAQAALGVRETTKVIPKTIEFKINSELEEIWLKKNRKKS